MTCPTGCLIPEKLVRARARDRRPCSPPSIVSSQRHAGAGAGLRIFRDRQVLRRQRDCTRSLFRRAAFSPPASSTNTSATSHYATLAQAFSASFVYFSVRRRRTANWRDALREALGPNGALLVDVVPELKLIIGEQPPVQSFQRRTRNAVSNCSFRRFIGVFARPEHPLALFLDDLQWIDSGDPRSARGPANTLRRDAPDADRRLS